MDQMHHGAIRFGFSDHLSGKDDSCFSHAGRTPGAVWMSLNQRVA